MSAEDPRLLPVVQAYAEANKIWEKAQALEERGDALKGQEAALFAQAREAQLGAVVLEDSVRRKIRDNPSTDAQLAAVRDQYVSDEISLLDVEQETQHILENPVPEQEPYVVPERREERGDLRR